MKMSKRAKERVTREVISVGTVLQVRTALEMLRLKLGELGLHNTDLELLDLGLLHWRR